MHGRLYMFGLSVCDRTETFTFANIKIVGDDSFAATLFGTITVNVFQGGHVVETHKAYRDASSRFYHRV